MKDATLITIENTNPFNLTVDRDAENLEEFFSTVSQEKREELIAGVKAIEAILVETQSYTPIRLFYDATTSNLAATLEELLFITTIVVGIISLQITRLFAAMDDVDIGKVNEMPKGVTLDKKYKKVD